MVMVVVGAMYVHGGQYSSGNEPVTWIWIVFELSEQSGSGYHQDKKRRPEGRQNTH